MISDVPTQAPRMPARSARRDGKLVKKSQPKRCEPSSTRFDEQHGQDRPDRRTSGPGPRSRTPDRASSAATGPVRIESGFRYPGRHAARWPLGLPELARQREADDVEDQRDEHQHQTGGENTLITDAAVGQIAEADLHDVRGDGGRLLARIECEIRLHAGGDRDDHRFADGARDAENESGGETGERARHDHAQRRLQAASRPSHTSLRACNAARRASRLR